MSRAADLAITPRSARTRAAAVNVVTRDPSTPRRPLLWCLFAGAAAVGSFVLILAVVFREIPAGGDPVPALLLLSPLCMATTWAFCWGWELYDAGRATRLWLVLVFGAVAVVIVVALVLLVLAASKSDADLDLDLSGMGGAIRDFVGSIPPEAAEATANALGSMIEDASAGASTPWTPPEPVVAAAATGAVAGAGAPLPPEDPGAPPCASCGFRYGATDRLACPRCGRPA
jgi:hypothetical protein